MIDVTPHQIQFRWSQAWRDLVTQLMKADLKPWDEKSLIAIRRQKRLDKALFDKLNSLAKKYLRAEAKITFENFYEPPKKETSV